MCMYLQLNSTSWSRWIRIWHTQTCIHNFSAHSNMHTQLFCTQSGTTWHSCHRLRYGKCTASASSYSCRASSASPSRWYPWLQSGFNFTSVTASILASEILPARNKDWVQKCLCRNITVSLESLKIWVVHSVGSRIMISGSMTFPYLASAWQQLCNLRRHHLTAFLKSLCCGLCRCLEFARCEQPICYIHRLFHGQAARTQFQSLNDLFSISRFWNFKIQFRTA